MLYGFLKSKGRDIVELDEQLIEEKVFARKDPVPITVVEYWEELDRVLADSPLGNPVNRIILAQQILEGCSTGTAPSAKPLKQEWVKLSEMSDQEIEQLIARTQAESKDISANEVVWTVAHMLNADLAEPFQIPILFIAGLKLDADQAGRVLEQLFQLWRFSDSAIHARISRIKSVLRCREGKPHKEGESHDRR